jgi:hypothetical protein
MCIQELQASANCISFHLQLIFTSSSYELDLSESGRVGYAVVVAPHIEVLDKGRRGDGTFSWVKISTVTGPVYISSIYAPSE